MNATNILTVTVIGLLAVMSPGPDFLIVTRNSLLHSKRAGLYTALGVTVGTMWWILASLAGISFMIAKTVLLFNALKWLGAGYLIYIGIQSFWINRTKTPADQDNVGISEVKEVMNTSSAFWSGLKINLLNPKAALFFVSFFSVIITPETPILSRCGYGFEISLIALVWFSLLASILSLGKVRDTFQRFSKWFERATGAVLILLGIKLALYERK
jgi:RhtB (resistance to homoserine/threonine) family protein